MPGLAVLIVLGVANLAASGTAIAMMLIGANEAVKVKADLEEKINESKNQTKTFLKNVLDNLD